MPADVEPEVEMSFAIDHCDSFIMTASSSTYAFWIAYLMCEKPIYYRRLTSNSGTNEKDFFRFDAFLPQWKAIREFARFAV